MSRFVFGTPIPLARLFVSLLFFHLSDTLSATHLEPEYCDAVIQGLPAHGIQYSTSSFGGHPAWGSSYTPSFFGATPVFEQQNQLRQYIGDAIEHYYQADPQSTAIRTVRFEAVNPQTDWCCSSLASYHDTETTGYLFGKVITEYKDPVATGLPCPVAAPEGQRFDRHVEQCMAVNGPNGETRWVLHKVILYGHIGFRKNAIQCPAGYKLLSSYYRACQLSTPELQACPDAPNPAKNAGAKHCEGNPCNVATGNKFQREIDYSGAGTYPLQFIRIYNSHSAPVDGPHFSFDKMAGWTSQKVGNGWNSNYTRKLFFPESKAFYGAVLDASAYQYYYLYRPDKNIIRFDRDTLEKIDKDMPGVLLRTDANTWQYINEQNEIETYTADGRLQSITFRGLTTTLVYEAEHPDTIAAVVGPFGKQLQFVYGTGRYLEKMIDPAGNEYHYQNSAHPNYRLEQVTYPAQTPDKPYRQYLNGGPTYHSYLTGIIDENGDKMAAWRYDSDGRAISSEHANGAERVDIRYDSDGRRTVTNAQGLERRYHFSVRQRVSQVNRISQKACDHCPVYSNSLSYDDNGYPDSLIDFNGTLTDYDFNSRGVEVQRIEAKGTESERTITTEWHPLFYLPIRISQSHRHIVYDYDSAGRVLFERIVDTHTQVSRQTDYYYYTADDFDTDSDPRIGLLKRIDGPRTEVHDTIRFEYNLEGEVTLITDSLGHQTHITQHDPHGRPLQLINPQGNRITLSYSARGWLQSIQLTDSASGETYLTRYEYDNVGQLIKQYLPSHSPEQARYLQYGYDAAHRLTDISDTAGNHIHYVLDSLGNRIREEISDSADDLKRLIKRQYNGLNQLELVMSGLGPSHTHYWENSMVYGDHGLPQTLTDGSGTVTQYGYDALNRLQQQIDNVSPAPGTNSAGTGPHSGTNSRSTYYSYNPFDALTSVTDPNGNSTRYEVNVFGDITHISSPDSGITQQQHDSAGNLIQQSDVQGQTVHYHYNANNQLIQARYSDGSQHTLQYGSQGNNTGRISSISSVSPYPPGQDNGQDNDQADTLEQHYQYDAHGNIIHYRRTLNSSFSQSTDYVYTQDSQLSQIHYPSGRTIDYERNASGQIHKITSHMNGQTDILASHIQYYPFGPVKSYTTGNGIRIEYQLDLDYRINSLQAQVDTQDYLHKHYGYDANNNITVIENILEPSDSASLSYDVFNQLTGYQQTAGQGAYQYDYDTNGNRTYQSHTMGPHEKIIEYHINTDNNQITQAIHSTGSTIDYAYDTNGNLLSDGRMNYHYDAMNRLSHISQNGQQQARYGYNHQNLRVYKKKPNQDTLIYSYDLQGRLIAETNPLGQPLKEYVYLGDRPIALYDYSAEERVITVVAQGSRLDDTLRVDIHLDAQGLHNISSETFGDSNTPATEWGVASEQWQSQAVTDNGEQEGAETFHYFVQYNNDLMLLFRHFDSFGRTCAKRTHANCKAAYIMAAQHTPSGYRYETYLEDALVITHKVLESEPELLFYVNDHLNTPQQLVDTAGVVRWSAEYTPFGIAHVNSDSTVTQNLRFTGQYYDEETGCHSNWNRYYCPAIGRYLTPDPIGLEGGLNTYGYVYNNPVNATDREGLWADFIADLGFIAYDLYALARDNVLNRCDNLETNLGALGADVTGLLVPMVTGLGASLRVTKDTTTVIGRIKDLQKLNKNEKSLLDRLPDKGNPQANWKQNSGVLRQEMGKGKPIRDASPGDTKGQFLNAERNLLESRGWTFDKSTNFWNPPK